ncbi:MAG: nucleotidyltransferase domain-containing protein [Lachnospiraceae bacterium]|nr:nucleotidyltransferase domain-containing protein [Candidatus Colinaster equi]
MPIELRPIVDELLKMKQQMPEMGLAAKVKELDDFINRELQKVKQAADEVIIPSQMAFLPVKGLQQLIKKFIR